MKKGTLIGIAIVGWGATIVYYIQRNNARFRCRSATFDSLRSSGMSDEEAMRRAEDECGRPGVIKVMPGQSEV